VTLLTKPNVLFFFTDDQRYDTIAALGNPYVKTPNMDELVRKGVSFTRAHIPGGSVGAVCMPSRAMLHTGRTLYHIENHGTSIPQEHVLLGEVLKNAGYRTFGTGKWHNGASSYARSFTDGAEIFFGGMGDHWNVPAYHYDPTGQYNQRSRRIVNPSLSNKVTMVGCDHISAGKHSSELFADCAIEWLEAWKQEQPFFMYISFMAPHDPRSMPDEYMKMYDPNTIVLPDNWMDNHPFDFGVSQIRDELLAPYPRTKAEIQRHLAEYYAMITHLDHQIGRVLEQLKQTGAYENTIIVFSGDNGLAVGQHGLMGKQSAYEHSVRVPLIFAGPGIPKHETREQYAYLLDIFPTLCDLTGNPVPSSVEGQSLLPVIQNAATPGRDYVYLTYESLVRAVKDDRYKWIEYRMNGATHHTQLFDLLTDPWEMNNLQGDPQYAAIESRLIQQLHAFRDAWDDHTHPTGSKFWGV